MMSKADGGTRVSSLIVFKCLALATAVTVGGCGSLDHSGVESRAGAATATPAFVQVNSATPQSAQTTVAVTFTAAQTVGNLNVVAVGWNDATTSVATVADSKGNSYQLAVGPTRRTGALSQSIYYAQNIAAATAGSNTVTVTFGAAAPFADVRIAEYSGIDPTNAFEVAVGSSGTGTSSSSGAVTTTNTTDLLVAANVVETTTTGAGTGYTKRIITNPDSDILEDRVVTAAGSQTATAPVSPSGQWVMQLAAFRAATLAPDTQPPTAPTNLTATAASATQINLAWTAATDNVGVTSYLIERCQGAGCSSFAQVATSTTASFSNTGLAAATSFSYRVRATDAAGNLGPYSNIATAVTTGGADTQPPTAPSNLTATVASNTRINLAWTAATDNVAVTQYLIERCQGGGCSNFAQIATSTAVSFANTGLTAGTSFSYRVRATDAAGNLGPYSNIATGVTTGGTDTQPPTAPSNLTATASSMTQINLAWTASTDNVAVTQYRIESCQGAGCSNFAQIATSTTTSFNNTGLTLNTSYSFRVRAADAAGNLGSYSNIATASTLPDTQAPAAPGGLMAIAVSGTQINLGWTAATDNVGVTGYLVESCQGPGCSNFAQIGTVTGTTFNNTGLFVATTYNYRVRATDAAGNLGAYSTVATTATLAPDTQPPSAPSNLVASGISNSQITLTWTAATDNVGVTSYLVERCQGSSCADFVQVGTAAGTSFGDNGLSAGTTYSYRARATDAAGNLGSYSSVAAGATQNAAAVAPAFVQGNYATPQGSGLTNVGVVFTDAQTLGNLNVVIVGWNDGNARVSSVSDTAGNTYQLAVGPTIGPVSQSIYYAKNIFASAPGANLVTVNFAPGAAFPDVRILEYQGIDTANPVDAVSSGQGTGLSASAPAIVTTIATDMIVAGDTVETTTQGPGPGYITRMITSPDSDIAEDWLVNHAGSWSVSASLGVSGGWAIQGVAFKAAQGFSGNDNTPPTVSVASPADGATVSGVVTVTFVAGDVGSGVAGVQLMVDGLVIGTPDTTSPYSISFDSAQLANGTHTLGAYAWDAVDNIGSSTSPATVTFNNANPNNPAVKGVWSGTRPVPIVSVNLHMMWNGKFIMSDGQTTWGMDARIWDSVTGRFNSITPPSNIFCSTGLHPIHDGRIITAGGHQGQADVGVTNVNIFDPATQAWSVVPNMEYPRWYPTMITLSDGREMILGGEINCFGCNATVPEIFDPNTQQWAHLESAPQDLFFYPHAHLLPDGRILVSSSARDAMVSQIFNLSTLTWSPIGGPAVDGGSSVMYAPGKILKMGTSNSTGTPDRVSQKTAYVLDATQGSPTWRQVQSMQFARTYLNSTMLPDGTALVTGGGTTGGDTDVANAVLPAELWSPSTETWATMASMNAPRLYHSEALLMPDGRVIVSGGGRADDVSAPTDQFSAEFFMPPYIFKAPRPVITSAPADLTYGQPFTVQTPNAAQIAKVSLMRYGAATHAFNAAQRYVPLTFTAGSGSLTINAPVDGNAAPPGYYMLFILDANGIPSVAATVEL